MLEIKDIKKIYDEGSENAVVALKGLSIAFRQNEFVSILGPSGCGKTTLLNIIGGLDRYSSGDLLINGVSTKSYTERDLDTYRNHSIGFVFQSYNLIPHLTILENVEMALTIGGVSSKERKERAKAALISVGLKDKLTKKPNELSGGQCQRVSIARAIVNDPDIILADEPTGALDTDTSEIVMDILKDIAKDRLVIMVTHNPDLAYKYSTRIVKMLDGEIIDDSHPLIDEEYNQEVNKINTQNKNITFKKKYASMSMGTAFKLSGLNLLSKIRRTVITALAASIGIMGIAIIMSISNGMQDYIDKTMADSTSFNYIYIGNTTSDLSSLRDQMNQSTDLEEYPENTTGVIPYVPQTVSTRAQDLSDEFINYLETNTKDDVIGISYRYGLSMNVLTQTSDGNYQKVSTSSWSEALDNDEYVSQYYTVLAKDDSSATGIPSEANEISLVVDSYNRLSTTILTALGIEYDSENLSEIKYEDLIGKEYRIVYNDGWYTPYEAGDGTTLYSGANGLNYSSAYTNEKGITVKIISVLRENEDATNSWLTGSVAYSSALTDLVLENNKNSAVALAQAAQTEYDVTTGQAFGKSISINGVSMGGSSYEDKLKTLGYTTSPNMIFLYPKNVEAREHIKTVISDWNALQSDSTKEIECIDMSSVVTNLLSTFVNVVTYVLMFFSITSLVISSIMIAIIIYASVIERTKEIGVLRSLGARKKDVGRIFEAEAVLLGLFSGVIAIILAYGIDVIINIILNHLISVSTIAALNPLTALALIALSVVLLLIASLIPASMASKKEPAVALRTE